MTTVTAPTLTATPVRSDAARPVWLVGAVAGVGAAVATTGVVVAAKAVDVPMKAAPHGAAAGRVIPLSGFPTATLMCTAIGTIVAMVLAWRARRPAPTFAAITGVLTLVSFAGPITTGHATTATRLVLSATHVVAAAIVIPMLTRRLAQRPARAEIGA